jgi:hypothetical protein
MSSRYRPDENEIAANRRKVLASIEGLMSISEIVKKTGFTTSMVNGCMVVFVKQENVEKVRLPGTARIKKNWKYRVINPNYVFVTRGMTRAGINPIAPGFRVENPFRLNHPYPINRAHAVAHYAQG